MNSDPGEPGDSQQENLRRLEALRLPPLRGKRFLDVKSRSGFFCAFARFEGASVVVGRDLDFSSQDFSSQDFSQSWTELPEGPFDVILLTSALHQAPDPSALVRALVNRLAPDGLLVLELGVARARAASPPFPSRRHVLTPLRGTAWKQMGSSPRATSEHVRWQVFHVRRRKPFAYLLLQPPAYGKSTLARELFAPADVRIISGDDTLNAVARGHLEAPSALATTIREDFSTGSIDVTIRRIIERGQAGDLIAFYLSLAASEDFALDAFLPADLHAEVERAARGAGYLPVHLKWGPPHPEKLALREWPQRVAAFGQSLEPGRSE